jgi:hypothetical protein
MADASRSPVDIRIDALVVEGLAPADAARFRDVVERELARLVDAHGLPQAPWARAEASVTLDGVAPHLQPPKEWAVAVAGAIYEALRP